MNRIILVGNGFDLSHGLKTRYEDFINWYWGRWLKLLSSSTNQIEKDELFEIKVKYNSVCLCKYFYTGSTEQNVYSHIQKTRKENGLYSIVSPFLHRISMSIETKGWVDIEADYYAMLVECKRKKDELEKLNKDFAVIQKLLVEYLLSVQIADIDNSYFKLISACLFAPFQAKDISIKSKDKWIDFLNRRLSDSDIIYNIELYKPFDAKERVRKVQEFKTSYKEQIEYCGVESINGDFLPQDMLYPDRIMLLNFNYTNTADFYFPDHSSFIINNIHGKLTKPENVIFGYGDESDDEYEKLQKMNDNEYLRHIKTCRYLETTKYRELLSFIDSAPFQVCIMGHSCGLSDRTMLNTLFEHENCVSIKPYYYVNDEGKDNYLDIVQNISRNFINPRLMRDRVVNKTYCELLPQVPRKPNNGE